MGHATVLVCLLVATLCGAGVARNEPDGFAGISGKGLSTTTGGKGGKTVTVTSFDDLRRYAESSDPYIVLVKGRITPPRKGYGINVKSNKTIVGLGTDATLYQIELHIIEQQNIIIRNLINRDSYVEGNWDCKDTDWDGIQADSSHHLWIDHCWFTHNCDGLIDLRHACDYVTVSWVQLSNHNKAFGIGWTEATDFRTTIHHCWFNNTNQRNPSFDMGIGHLYNNYISDIASYGNLARGKARVIIENSYYENSNNPVKISDEAKLYVTGLDFSGCEGSKSGNMSTPPYDIGEYYDYTLDKTSEVKATVTAGAGPQEGIGEWYLDPTGTDAPLRKKRAAATLDVTTPGVSGTIAIRTVFPGNYKVVITNLHGRVVDMFSGNETSLVHRTLPGRGVYLFSIIANRSHRAVHTALVPYR